jgi:hypothetical protein
MAVAARGKITDDMETIGSLVLPIKLLWRHVAKCPGFGSSMVLCTEFPGSKELRIVCSDGKCPAFASSMHGVPSEPGSKELRRIVGSLD